MQKPQQKLKMMTLSLCLSLGLTQIVLPAAAFARAEGATRSRVVKTSPAPIGSLDSKGAVLINGRAAHGRQTVWNGELIQAAADAPVSVALTALGQIKMTRGALVQVSKTGNANQQTLIASVYEGEAEIALAPAANAYLEAAGQVWVASGATLLKLSVNAGKPSLQALRGKVSPLGNWALNLAGLPVAKKDLANAPALTPVPTTEDAALLRSIKLLTQPAGAGSQPAVRLLTAARATMIGMIESAGALKLNGRAVRRQELLWDGELIQASDADARVALNNVGRALLTQGTSAKLSLTSSADASSTNRVLAANLLKGELTLRLEPNVAAYVETQGKTFAAEPGAHFRVSEQAGNVTLEIKAGNVREIAAASVNVSPALLNDERKTGERQYDVRPADQGGYLRRVNPSETQSLRFLVTDRTGKAAAGMPVVFTLNAADGQLVGTLGHGPAAGQSFTTRTDDNGFVQAPFNAGRAKGSVSITAAVAGAAVSNRNVLTVADKDSGFWTKRNALPVFVVIGGAIAAGVIVGITREEKLPIQGRGAATIVP